MPIKCRPDWVEFGQITVLRCMKTCAWKLPEGIQTPSLSSFKTDSHILRVLQARKTEMMAGRMCATRKRKHFKMIQNTHLTSLDML